MVVVREWKSCNRRRHGLRQRQQQRQRRGTHPRGGGPNAALKIHLQRRSSSEEWSRDDNYDDVQALFASSAGNGRQWKLASNETLLLATEEEEEEEGTTIKKKKLVRGALVYVRVDNLELQILQLVVCPHTRRKGVGTALLRHTIEAAAAGRDDARVILEVEATNEAAKALYAKEGFVVNGRRRAYYADGGDALLMTRENLSD